MVHTGVLGVGGDHLTNDIVSGLKIPYAKAELLKKTEGSVILDANEGDERITLPGAYNFEERQIYRVSLNTIMQARQAEIFGIILEIYRRRLSGLNSTERFTSRGEPPKCADWWSSPHRSFRAQSSWLTSRPLMETRITGGART